MSEYLPREVREGLEVARKDRLKRSSRLRVRVDGHIFQVLRSWKDGFALDADDSPHLRGLVDLYQGDRHVSQCLIVASAEEAGEMRYEFKRRTLASDRRPLDFARDEQAPVALLEQRPL